MLLKNLFHFSSVSNIEENLKKILIQDINSKHPAFGSTIKVDTSSIIIKRDLEHTYHSESFVKEALNESMAAIYPKLQTPQNGKDKTLQTRVGVVRKTTVKPTNKRDPDEPDIDTENIPVVQGSFQITKTEADITENKQNPGSVKHDEKITHKPATAAKSTTTTKIPATRITTTKRVPTSTPKSRPFTIKSTLNVKTRTEATPKKKVEQTTTNIGSSSSTTVSTTTNNVSQILFDLLTNENHYKDLPKIDTLFTVPHVNIDNEPWRPITQPYYETTNKPVKPSSSTTESITDLNAEDRMGVAEVIDDISILESVLTPIPPVRNREKTTRKPLGIHNKNSYHGVENSNPVYTSFTLPTFAPPLKNMETLGSSYPKPFPIPVDKISSVVEGIIDTDDEDDGKPVFRPPPKDKKTSATINVLEFNQNLDDTEQISIEGGSILKKHNSTTTTSSTTPPSTTTSEVTSTSTASTTTTITTTTISTTTDKEANVTHLAIIEQTTNAIVKENSTRRPNNKVSIIPSTSAPYHSWELVNTSTNEKNETPNKLLLEKFYNDTLQAIITKNDAVFPNTTPKFPSKVSIMRNITDLIKKYTQKPTEKVEIVEERHNHNKMGSVEVVIDEEIETTTAGAVITLLPAKSNLGVNRPLRPRPPIRPQPQIEKENLRSFFLNNQESEQGIRNSPAENYIKNKDNEGITESSEIVTDESTTEYDYLRESEGNPASIGIRFPKSNEELKFSSSNNFQTKDLPKGTYRVSYHVTGSVSSKQANKTQNLPAYELTLEPDVVLEIPVNQSNTLTIDKLKQLANLATISDSNNNTLFRTPGGGVISTKAIPSSYTLNQAGFKILTKTFNKAQSTKQDDNSLERPEKNYNKPHKFNKEKDNFPVKEINEGG